MARTKKEIDKEIMFKKIMPSSLKPLSVQQPLGESMIDQAESHQMTSAPMAPDGEQPHKPILEPDKGVQLRENKPTLLTNIMERLVSEKLDAAITKFRCCKCDKCKKDVAAITLNKLKPKYVVADQADALDAFTERQTNAEVTTALVQAILVVKTHPRH